MERWTAKALEFAQVKKCIQNHATSTLGKERVNQVIPLSDIDEVKRRLAETAEALDYLRLKGAFPLGGFRDIRSSLKRAHTGGMLLPDELLQIVSTLYAGRKARSALRQVDVETAAWPILRGMTEQISRFPEVENEILRCIDEQGVVKDQASPALKSIRQQLAHIRQRTQQVLQQMLRNRSMQKKLQEPIITQRFDRYVIPVKQEYRSAVEGIVHDQSASGATLFIEPSAVVALNNQLRESEIREQQEVESILNQLTTLVAEIVEPLLVNVEILSQLDFAFAKAEFGKSMRAICPQITTERTLRLKKARHPLISAGQVVPIDIALGGSYQAIIITGPNTGGKTVSLKTVGLFALMTQCGFPITAEEGSQMPVFSGVFADIGDEQSIEQNLSTFSAHMTKITQILQQIDSQSLVLFDELGAGTDPTEGAALAIAILEQVLATDCLLIATTHFSELKLFAHTHPQTINASVEFDMHSLRPTYRLLIGVPGSSNAFHISERLGLAPAIIARAKQHLSVDDQRLEEMIRAFTNEKRQMEHNRQEAEQFLHESKQLWSELQAKMHAWEAAKDKIKEKAHQEARQIVKHAESEAAEVLQQLRSWAEAGSKTAKEHQLIAARKRLLDAAPGDQGQVSIEQETLPVEKLEIGDEVWVRHLGQMGTIVDHAGEKKFMVSVGMLKIKVKQEQLEKRAHQKKASHNQLGSTMVKRSSEPVRSELDLRGKMVDEALPEIDKFLDNVVLSGYRQVSIIHGKGTGALRNGVQQFLKQHHHVKGFRLGVHGEGGSGVTVVDLK